MDAVAQDQTQQKDTSADRHLAALRQLFTELESVLICFSGGIDSALLLTIAHQQLGTRAHGMTAVSPSIPQRELNAARAFARNLGAIHHLVESHEMDRPLYRQNGPDRCFHCKTELYTIARDQQLSQGIAHIVNGTNQDDLGDYRPGLEAAKEAGVRSPFVELGMGKNDVRAVALRLGLEIWDKPAAACLSSRLPYGVSVTRERLDQVERFEQSLSELGFGLCRVRYHEELARIEVSPDDITRMAEPSVRAQVVALGRGCGFQYVTLDLTGYRTGSHNEILSGRKLKTIT